MNVVVGNADEATSNNKDLPAAPEGFMVNSLKSKLPSTLIIKSTNLRVLDLIGQGLVLRKPLICFSYSK